MYRRSSYVLWSTRYSTICAGVHIRIIPGLCEFSSMGADQMPSSYGSLVPYSYLLIVQWGTSLSGGGRSIAFSAAQAVSPFLSYFAVFRARPPPFDVSIQPVTARPKRHTTASRVGTSRHVVLYAAEHVKAVTKFSARN